MLQLYLFDLLGDTSSSSWNSYWNYINAMTFGMVYFVSNTTCIMSILSNQDDHGIRFIELWSYM